ncbi:cyclase family protein [Amycolatopsis viridis]|uniref:Kynurenine formamidase n=1 Tax=Amycolatopsis viridis TaxID=185678 RepID=A0ABX0T1A5_9PSEU|nr:cyclase family protein [Amycolatopsis viridis]NIH83014.1 kynurenine formamidase [Amycolatopsis viridis]
MTLAPLAQALAALRAATWVDLTHTFHDAIPHSPAFEPESRTVVSSIGQAADGSLTGFLSHEYRHVGQWGTHVDPPAHFVPGLRHQDEIPVEEMILPLVVLDITAQAGRDPDYVVSDADLADWESRNGRVPAGSFVALRTGWSARWPSQQLMLNADADGVCHFPGWSRSVLETLFEHRGVTACGHETTDTDPGLAVSRGDSSLERYVLGTDHYQIELLANLDQLPETGALIIATWPKALHGSGFPARVFAIHQKD